MNTKRGTCEVCDTENVDLYSMYGNILMCANCKAQDEAVTARQANVIDMIESSNKIDASIQLKSDLFNASTIAAVELRAAIEQNEEVPAAQKDYVYAQECLKRFKHLQQVIFDERKALLEKENEMRMWQGNVQTAAGKLREELKAQFKEVDVTYQPTPVTVKKVKAAATSKPSKKAFDKNALAEAAKKYDVPQLGIQSMVVSRNMSYEDAGRELAKIMGKSLPTS